MEEVVLSRLKESLKPRSVKSVRYSVSTLIKRTWNSFNRKNMLKKRSVSSSASKSRSASGRKKYEDFSHSFTFDALLANLTWEVTLKLPSFDLVYLTYFNLLNESATRLNRCILCRSRVKGNSFSHSKQALEGADGTSSFHFVEVNRNSSMPCIKSKVRISIFRIKWETKWMLNSSRCYKDDSLQFHFRLSYLVLLHQERKSLFFRHLISHLVILLQSETLSRVK
jgi:hypothetical protein